MKICLYCDSVNDDSAKVCSACGASQFKNKCNNCGTIFESSFCPTCGTKAGTQAKVCPQCGERYFSPACPRCGHNGVVNRVQQQVVEEPQRIVVEHVTRTEEKPKKKVTFGKILLWIFFLPIMVIIAIWRSKLAVKWKIVLTAVIAALMLLYTYGNKATKTEGNTSSTATSKIVSSVETAKPVATQKTNATAVPVAEQKPARNGFDKATNAEYSVRRLHFSMPAYFGNPLSSSKETQLIFQTDSDTNVGLLVIFSEQNITQKHYDEKGEELALQFLSGLLENPTVISEKEARIANLPGHMIVLSGKYSGIQVEMRTTFAFDAGQPGIYFFVLLQGEDLKYDYSADFDLIVQSAVIQETNEPQKDASGVSADLKAMLDEYEAFVDSYCEFMKKYNEASDVSGLAMEYMNILSKYSSWAQKIDNIKEENLSNADLLYYEEVMLRCSNKMLKAAGN